MDLKQYKAAVEAMLFANAEPVSRQKLAAALEIEESVVERLLLSLRDDLEAPEHGVCLLQLEDRWQLATKNDCAPFVRRILDTRRNTPLSPAALETLTIIAYNQPVSRSFIEQVRGVDSSSSVSGLLEKGLIEEAGRLDLPGHPVSFRTTDVFLRTFGLSSLAELPPLHTQPAAPEGLPEEPPAAAQAAGAGDEPAGAETAPEAVPETKAVQPEAGNAAPADDAGPEAAPGAVPETKAAQPEAGNAAPADDAAAPPAPEGDD